MKMGRKRISLLLVVALLVSMISLLAACNQTLAPAPTPTPKPEETKFEIALVTDVGTIDDKSFNQGAWEGVVKYAEENKKTYKYYQPASDAKDDLLASIGLAVQGGAKIIVCPGFNFEVALYEAQKTYPETRFVLLDGVPHTEDWATFETKENVKPILYAEHQAGFLAGYATVKEGYRSFGFMGGQAVPAVIRFGYGFIQGADYAAEELGLGAESIAFNYNYTGKFEATPEAQTMASGWYSAGTEVIFGCGGSLGDSVMAAAAATGKFSIGVDVDQSSESESVITSAMKNLTKSVYDSLTEFYAGTFPGGKTMIVDVTTQGVGLPMETSKFENFKQADYDAIYEKLVKGEVEIKTDTDVESADALTTTRTIVTVIQ